MPARIIDGKGAAAALVAKVGAAVERLQCDAGLAPGLAVVLVGEHPASAVYVRNKIRQCETAGIRSLAHRLPETTTEAGLMALIGRLNADPDVHGILVQLPLPSQIGERAVLAAIDPAKDVDGFHLINAGRLFTGQPGGLVPCTPVGCLRLIKAEGSDLSGANAVVVGRSNLLGQPMAMLLLAENCTVTLAHSKSRALPEICRAADVLVAAVGRPQMVRGDWIKPGAVVIDVGINRIEAPDGKARLVGDVAFDEARAIAGAITPVPGGVGPMTVACLLRNTVLAACRLAGVAEPRL